MRYGHRIGLSSAPPRDALPSSSLHPRENEPGTEFRAPKFEEIRAQRIEAIDLHDPKRPHGGRVYFRGPEDGVMCWRCDLVDVKPRNVGADS